MPWPDSLAAPTALALAETTDWSTTTLGPREAWPAGLAAVIGTVLKAPIPAAVVYGPDLTLVYNDRYGSLLGGLHPGAFARPAPDILTTYWSRAGRGNEVERVLTTGQPFYEAETLVSLRQVGSEDRERPEGLEQELHYSRAYVPVPDDQGRVMGVLIIINEGSVAARTLSGIAELATALSSALSVDDVARAALRHAIETVHADHARVTLADGPALRMARRTGVDRHDDSAARLPPVWVRVPATSTLPSVQVTRSGSALWLDEADLPRFDDLADEPLGGGRQRTIASVPLHTGGLQGALSLGWERPHQLTAAERAALLTAGNIVGQAVARAQRFEEQRGNADTLQRSMLPAQLPHVPGISIGARYQPSAPGTSAGGDFYDAFTVADGRVLLAIGDVVGHGVLAAAVMGQVRAALRVLALRQPAPIAVLAGLDPFVASLGPETFVTALVALLDVPTRRLELVTAGHPPPLIIHRGNDFAVIGGSSDYLVMPAGPPLGISAERVTVSATLDSGDALLLFTDGLVEVPGQDIDTGLEALRTLTRERLDINDSRRLCSLVLDRLGSGDDDIAVVAVTMDDSPRRTAAIDLPAESTAPGVARTWAHAALTDWGLGEDTVQTALLATNELVTNALLHARSGSHVELDLDDHRLLVLVSDAGMTTSLHRQHADPTAVRGRGLDLLEAITDAWGSERSSRGTTVWFELTRSAAS